MSKKNLKIFLLVIAALAMVLSLIKPVAAEEYKLSKNEMSRLKVFYLDCRQSMAGVMTAVYVYKEREGHYPDSLNELVPGYLRKFLTCRTLVKGKTTEYPFSYKIDRDTGRFKIYIDKKGIYKGLGVPANGPYYDSVEGFYFPNLPEIK